MQRGFSRMGVFSVALGLVLMAVSSAAVAQSYHRNNLVSNLSGKAAHMDPLLKNPWGLVYGPGAPFSPRQFRERLDSKTSFIAHKIATRVPLSEAGAFVFRV